MRKFNLAGLSSAVLIVVVVTIAALLASCGGGSITATEPDNIDIHPTPTVTLEEQMATTFGANFHGLFEAYDDAGLEFLRVVWKNPSKQTLQAGDSATFGVDQVYAKFFDPATKTYREVPITTYQEVQAVLAGFGRMTNAKMIYEALGIDLNPGDTREATVSVGFQAEDWANLWNKISGGKLDSFKADFNVEVVIDQGYVKFRKSDPTAGITTVVVGVIWWAARTAVVTTCPDMKKSWPFNRPESVTPPPSAFLNPTGPTSAHAGDNITIAAQANVDWTATWLNGGYHSSTNGSSFTVVMPNQDLVVTFIGGGLERKHTVTLISNPPPTGPTWGGEPFDISKLVTDLEPDGPDAEHTILLDSTLGGVGEKTNPFIGGVYYDQVQVISGQGGRFWTVEITCDSAPNALSVDKIFDSGVSGPGVFIVKAVFTLETLPSPTQVTVTRRLQVD